MTLEGELGWCYRSGVGRRRSFCFVRLDGTAYRNFFEIGFDWLRVGVRVDLIGIELGLGLVLLVSYIVRVNHLLE